MTSYTFETIPHSSEIAVRLGQCLQPNLSPGVHIKTLELYKTIFSILGDNLSDQIDIWIPGILPLMPYASINVKPNLIDLLKQFILPLKSLRNIVLPLLYSLLPGIDDRSNESFEAVLSLIDGIKEKINDDSHFWQCYFLVIINSSDRRLGALEWAKLRLPKFESVLSSNCDPPTDKSTAFQAISYAAQSTITPEPGLLIRAFCKGLEDDQILVQRDFLELLVKNIELHSPALQFVVARSDLKLLLISACSATLRRDMSLNRRLWNWLLGPSPDSSTTVSPVVDRQTYFVNYGCEELVNGLLEMINSDTDSVVERCRPFRICLSIMDHWEIGANVIPKVLTPIIKSVKRCESKFPPKQYAEIVRSAGAFFDGVETITIWSDCMNLIKEGSYESLSLLMFILQTFNVEEEEMIVQHIPLMLIVLMKTEIKKESTEIKLELIETLLNLIPDRAFLPLFVNVPQTDDEENATPILDSITEYYTSSPDDTDSFPFSAAQITSILQEYFTASTINYIDKKDYIMAGHFASFLSHFLNKIYHKESKWRDDKLVESLKSIPENCTYDYSFVSTINSLFITIIDGLTNKEIEIFLKKFVSMIWKFLVSVSGTREVEAVKSLWQLQEALEDRRVEASIASLFVNPQYTPEERGRALCALWNHSSDRSNADMILNRCIFLILGDLQYPNTLKYLVAKNWIEQVVASGSVNRLLSFITAPILCTPFIHREQSLFMEDDDLETFSFYCNTLLMVLKAHPLLKRVFIREFIPMEHSFAFLIQSESLKGKDSTYSIVLKNYILKLFSYDIPKSNENYLESSYESVLFVCLDLLDMLVDDVFDDIVETTESLMSLLKKFKNSTQTLAQIRVIHLLSTLLKSLGNLGPFNTDEIDTGLPQEIETEHKNPTAKRLEKLSKDLVNCLRSGFPSNSDLYVVESWTNLLSDSVPLFGGVILQILLPLVESLTSQISEKFKTIKNSYSKDNENIKNPIALSVLFSYMKALEKLLTVSHKQLSTNDTRGTVGKSSNESGFFGSVMSGVFTVESPLARSTAANNRLTVLLSFQDTIHKCFYIWNWVEENSKISTKSTADSQMYHSARLKFWTRKIMESLYKMETLETLEMCIEVGRTSPYIFKVLHSLDGSKPKSTIPHIFNSLISRVNPSSVDLKERSTLTTELTDYDIAKFLVDYLRSLENDAVEDIWHESISFLKEIQNNISLYKHLMPEIFQFISVLAVKVNTLSFGEQRRTRRELSDIFVKLFNNALSSRTIASSSELYLPNDSEKFDSNSDLVTSSTAVNEKGNSEDPSQSQYNRSGQLVQENLANVLAEIVPNLHVILNDSDKTNSALSTILTNFIIPLIKSKYFLYPAVDYATTLLSIVISYPQSQKIWKGAVGDIIMDQRFLNLSVPKAEKWKKITNKWAHADKDRLQDYISRILSHGSNSNVLFGWSEQEATYTHRNLNRLAYIFLSGGSDGYLLNMKDVIEKMEDAIHAESSIDSLRSEVFNCLRAIILKVDPTHLANIWTFVYSELYNTFTKVLSIYSCGKIAPEYQQKEPVFLRGLTSACKLLDLLLILGVEDFNP